MSTSVPHSSNYVTWRDPFLEPKGEAGWGSWGPLGVEMALSQEEIPA